MLGKIRANLTYANVASSIALFIALAGGTAWAVDEWTGANIQNGTLTSADYKNNNIQSADLRDNDVRSIDVANDSTGSALTGDDIDDGSLTGADIADQSGVDTCTHGTVRFGELCVGVANEGHTWDDSLLLCSNLNLRLPTISEAVALGKNYDLPSISGSDYFWSGYLGPGDDAGYLSDDNGSLVTTVATHTAADTVCVTTPTN